MTEDNDVYANNFTDDKDLVEPKDLDDDAAGKAAEPFEDSDGDGIPDLTEAWPADHELVDDPESLVGDEVEDDEDFDFVVEDVDDSE